MDTALSYDKFLLHHRVASGYKTQKALADASGVTSATISRIENGIQKPSVETIRTLAPYLKTTTFTEFMMSAGYFMDVSDEQIQALNEFFEQSINVKEDMLNLVTQLSYFSPTALQETKEEIVKLLDLEYIEHGDFPATKNEIKYFLLKYCDEEEQCSRVIEKLNAIIEKCKNSDPYKNEKEFLNKIDQLELTSERLFNDYKISVDGVDLTEKEVRKLIALIRLDRQDG